MFRIAVPSIDLSDFDLRHLDHKVVTVARDATYIAIGFSVLAFQRAQVRRVEAQKVAERLANSLAGALTGARGQAK